MLSPMIPLLVATIGSLVLVPAAVAKLVDPTPASVALRELGVRANRGFVRAIALGELAAAGCFVVSALGLIAPRGPGAALALTYAVFAVIVRRLMVLDTSCGCFGASPIPPGVPHLIVNVSVATAAGWTAVAQPSAPGGGWWWAGTVLAAWAVVLFLTSYSELMAHVRDLRARDGWPATPLGG